MRVRGLPASDYPRILSFINEAARVPDLEAFPAFLVEHLRRRFSFPIALFAYKIGEVARLVPFFTRERTDGELRQRQPIVYGEQAGFCVQPPAGPITVACRDFPPDLLASLATTQEYWPRYGIRDAAALFFVTPTGHHGALSLCTETQDPRLLGEMTAFLRELGPHVSNTVDNLLRLEEMRVQRATLDEVTRVEDGAVVVVSQDGRPFWMSGPARVLLRSLGGDGERLPRAIVERCEQIGLAHREGDESQIPAMEPQILRVRGRRIIARYLLIPGCPRTWIMIHLDDRGGKAWNSFERRAACFGLTPREREIALRVVEGLSNKEIASGFGISLQTVKNHLKAVFRKAGCRNRAEAVRLFAGSPGWDGHPGPVGA